MNKNIFIILLIGILAPSLGWAQKTKSIASIEKDSILIGDHLKLRIEVNTTKNTKISWPTFSEELASGVELLSLQPIDTIPQDGDAVSYIQNLSITSFDTGFYEIPGFNFSCFDQIDTNFYKSISNPLFLRVITVEVDTAQAFKPIKGPIEQSYTFTEALPMMGGFLLLLAAAFAIYYFFFRKKNEPLFTAKAKVRIPAHISALNNLEILKTKKLWQEGRFKDFYTELTDIFRIYLDERFEVDALEMTSDEIRESIEPINEIDKKLFNKISETLFTSDLVKFAKLNPIPEENERSISIMEDFVKETMKKPENKETGNKDKDKLDEFKTNKNGLKN
jgi:hypothetical protein